MTEAHKHIFIDLLYPYIYKNYVLLCFCAFVLLCFCQEKNFCASVLLCFCYKKNYVLLSKKNWSNKLFLLILQSQTAPRKPGQGQRGRVGRLLKSVYLTLFLGL